LYILNFSGRRPILNGLNLGLVHRETLGRDDIAEKLHRIDVEDTFLERSVKAGGPKPSENFAHMFSVFRRVFGVDEDIVEVNDHVNVEEVGEEVVHEPLKSRGSVGQTFGHNVPFERAIAGAEGSLPFVAVGNPNKVIRVLEVDFSEDLRSAAGVQEVRDQGKRVAILASDAVKTSEVDAKPKFAGFLFDKQNRSAVRRRRLFNETVVDILVEELAQGLQLQLGKGINGTVRRRSAFLEVNFEVVRPVRRQLLGLGSREDVGKVSVLRGQCRQVRRFTS
jgi:hypothetical protein